MIIFGCIVLQRVRMTSLPVKTRADVSLGSIGAAGKLNVRMAPTRKTAVRSAI